MHADGCQQSDTRRRKGSIRNNGLLYPLKEVNFHYFQSVLYKSNSTALEIFPNKWILTQPVSNTAGLLIFKSTHIYKI